jgi:hypothetical protein
MNTKVMNGAVAVLLLLAGCADSISLIVMSIKPLSSSAHLKKPADRKMPDNDN